MFRSRERKHFSLQNKLMRKGLKYRDADVCVQLSFFYFPNLNSSSASLMSLTLVALRSSSHFLVAEIKLAPPSLRVINSFRFPRIFVKHEIIDKINILCGMA